MGSYPAAGAAVYPFVVEMVSRRVPANGTVLEIGCGAMQYAPLLPGAYIGLDRPRSPHVRESPHLLGSAERIELPDGAVDVVFGVATFYYIDEIEQALAECRRVLRPGGTFLAFDYRSQITSALVRGGDLAVRHHWNARELKRLLRAAGFRRVHDVSHHAAGSGAAPLLRLPVRRVKLLLRPTWTQWLVVEGRG